jgi:hypothetical protein
MRNLGAAGVALSLIVLIYVVARISFELGGTIAVVVTLGIFSAVEAVLFWTTRFRIEAPKPGQT